MATSNKKLLVTKASLLGAKDATRGSWHRKATRASSKKRLLVTKGIATRSKGRY